ncbi:ArsA family ATPase [Nocardia sp. NPDC127526]|uniref:ArsA family ATPase n=1 Tax=Nocardia sp. NPDC127526 TaxID=3345393 RepID=UPI00363475E1
MELFVGKGGVGKTTLACATALAYARSGQKVLLASLDQAHSLGDALGFRFRHQPGAAPAVAKVQPFLDVIEVDSLALLENRFRQLAIMLSGSGHEHGFDLGALDPAELTGLPGVQEILALLEITDFADGGQWDVIVLDCPPSADMLRIITAPDTVLGYLDRVWPEHSRALTAGGLDFRRAVLAVTVQEIVAAIAKARDLIADHTRTGARLVTAPEHVAIAESARVRSAAALLGLRLDAVLVNKVLPEMPGPNDSGAPHGTRTPDPAAPHGIAEEPRGHGPFGPPVGPETPAAATAAPRTAQASYGPRDVRHPPASNPTVALFGSDAPDPFAPSTAAVAPPHPAVQWYFNRRGEQLAVVAELRKRMSDMPVRVVGHTGAEPVGLGALETLSYAVDASGDWVGQRPVPMLGSDADGVLSTPGTGIAEPVVRLESGTGVQSVFAMRMHLPVVDPSTLQLGRVEDDLIVGADGVRRRLRLAPVLRRCTVEAAELDGDQLVIRFRPDPKVWPK